MIVVVADDLSGAAELAGMAHQRGLRGVVQTSFRPTDAEVICVDTDSRSLTPIEAARRVSATVAAAMEAGATCIYKKVDSLLRGPVLAELQAFMTATHHDRLVLAAANPALGRTIRGGVYYIGGDPLHRSALAGDPEHPARTSDVAGLLGGGVSRRTHDTLPTSGVVIADAQDAAELGAWLEHVNGVAAGAGDFFDALLARRFDVGASRPVVHVADAPALIVCGSAAAWNSHRAAEVLPRGYEISVMPDAVLQSADHADALTRWAAEVAGMLVQGQRVMIAIGREDRLPLPPTALADRLVEAAVEAIRSAGVQRVAVEGGGTASRLVQRLNLTQLTVAGVFDRGVVELLAEGSHPLTLIVKPGSYRWNPGVFASPLSPVTQGA